MVQRILHERFRETDLPHLLVNVLIGNAYNGLKALEPLDYIYGIMAMVDDFTLVPDYTKPVSEVYVTVAIHGMRTEGLKVLSFCRLPKLQPDLPSWVPDWSALPSGRLYTIWQDYDTHQIWQARKHWTKFTEDHPFSPAVQGSTLILSGRKISSIKAKYFSVFTSEDAKGGILHRIWTVQMRLLFLQKIIDKDATAYFTPEDRRFALATSLLCGGFEGGRVTNSENKQSLEALLSGYNALTSPTPELREGIIEEFMTWPCGPTKVALSLAVHLFDDETDDKNIHELFQDRFYGLMDDVIGIFSRQRVSNELRSIIFFLERAREVNIGRIPFICVDGYLGLGPTELESGDLIVYFDTALIPFILRPLPGDTFRLIGEAYVFGIMDGDSRRMDGPRESPEHSRTTNPRPAGERREFRIV